MVDSNPIMGLTFLLEYIRTVEVIAVNSNDINVENNRIISGDNYGTRIL